MAMPTPQGDEGPAERFSPGPPTGHDVFVPTSAGLVHVHRQGSGKTLVLLHSNGHSWHEFGAALDPLATRFDVVAWDMPGQAWSDPVHPRTSVERYADILTEVLDHLQIDEAPVVGCSVGACVAAALGHRHAERVTGVGLIEFQFREASWWTENWPLIEAMFAVPTQPPELIAARFESDVDDAVLQRWNIERNLAGARSLMGVMWAIREFDIGAAIASLAEPPLMVFGSVGPTIGARPAIEAAVPEARIEVVERAGHFVSIDRPDAFVRLATELVKRS